MARAATILSPGETLGGFRIVDVIGFGGMAVVYRAEQVSLGRPVALKVLSPQLSSDEAFRERFRREGKHAAALDHPNIVAVYDSGESEGRLYLAMRLVEGTTLGERMHERGLSAQDTIDILRQIARALDVAHDARLVHRDVKPQNILLAEDGHPYLADFGVAKGPQTHGLTATGGFVGSLNYAAPEQILGHPATAAGDVYALTAVLYQCLTGQVPYPRETDAGVMHAHLNEPPPRLLGADPIEAKVSQVIVRGMAKSPRDRFARAGELMDAASVTLEELPPSRRRDIPAFPTRTPNGDNSAANGADRKLRTRPPAIDRTNGGATDAVELPAVGRSGDHTEIVSAQDRLAERRKIDATTADRRRATATTAETSITARRRWPLAVAGFLVVAAVAGSIVALSGAGAASSIRTAHAGVLSLSYSSPWRMTARSSAGDARLLVAPVGLTAGKATLSAGRLLTSASIPGGVPPELSARLRAPSSQSSALLGVYAVRRYLWSTPARAQTLALVLASQPSDLAVVCRGPASALAACVAVAKTINVQGTSIDPPGPNATVAKALVGSLRPVSIARANLAGLAAAHLQARASTARRIAVSETGAASALSTTTVPPRNRADAATIVDALRSEAGSWQALAQAAARDQRTQYETASKAVTAQSQRLASAAVAARTQGFRIPTLAMLKLPGLPRSTPRPKRVKKTPPTTGVQPTQVQPTQVQPTQVEPTQKPATKQPATGSHSGSSGSHPKLVPAGNLS